VRYVLTDSATADIDRLSARDRAAFKDAARLFSDAADRYIEDPAMAWPASLRVKPVAGAKGVWEMTWSFSGPDGRATWEWTSVVIDEKTHPAVRWRRVGDHRVFAHP
jgi:hypothetical protein